MNNHSIVNDEDYKEMENENLFEKYENYENDLIKIENIYTKLLKILRINYKNTKKNVNIFLTKYMKLIENHNNLNLYKINTNNKLFQEDTNQNMIILIYIEFYVFLNYLKQI